MRQRWEVLYRQLLRTMAFSIFHASDLQQEALYSEVLRVECQLIGMRLLALNLMHQQVFSQSIQETILHREEGCVCQLKH